MCGPSEQNPIGSAALNVMSICVISITENGLPSESSMRSIAIQSDGMSVKYEFAVVVTESDLYKYLGHLLNIS